MAEFTLIIQSINGEVTNVTESGIAGEALTSGQLVYLHTDGKWYKATSINVNKCSTELRLTTESKSTNELINLLLYGELIVSGPLTTGSKYYVGETLGTVTDTPSINDNHYQTHYHLEA